MVEVSSFSVSSYDNATEEVEQFSKVRGGSPSNIADQLATRETGHTHDIFSRGRKPFDSGNFCPHFSFYHNSPLTILWPFTSNPSPYSYK
nr:hypothetical protein Itr_chr01CG00630 [Ipomoea trifida]